MSCADAPPSGAASDAAAAAPSPRVILVTGGTGLVGAALREYTQVGAGAGAASGERWVFACSADADLRDRAATFALFARHRPSAVSTSRRSWARAVSNPARRPERNCRRGTGAAAPRSSMLPPAGVWMSQPRSSAGHSRSQVSCPEHLACCDDR